MPDIGQSLIIFAVLLFSLTVHEMAHAVTADWLGDPTARRLGRISLNPAVHIDPVGTIMLPLLGLVAGGFVFGWAKPVPVNPANLKNHRQDFLVIAAAGPASNIIMAIGASMLADWPRRCLGFTKVMPTDYKRVLDAARMAEAEGRDVDSAIMEAARG